MDLEYLETDFGPFLISNWIQDESVFDYQHWAQIPEHLHSHSGGTPTPLEKDEFS